MSYEYKLPDVGEGLTEAEIVSWRVKEGDAVEINDVVVEIETAKSLVELPSPHAGTVAALLVAEGETVEVGTPIIRIGEQEIDLSNPAASGGGEGESLVGRNKADRGPTRRPRRGSASPTTEAGAAAQMQVQGAFGQGGAHSEPVVEADGSFETVAAQPPQEPVWTVAAQPPQEPVWTVAAQPPQEPAETVAAQPPQEPAETVAAQPPQEPVWTVAAQSPSAPAEPGVVRALAKPPVRKLARDLGVDLAALTGTGPAGSITREDVHSSVEERPRDEGASRDQSSRERREPVKGVRKMMGQAMVASAFSAPHVTVWITVDVTRTTEFVQRLRGHRDFREVKVSPLLVLARACLLAMRRTPEINSWWDEAAQEVVYKSYVNLGIAAATPRGLVVPNVKDAEQLSLLDLAMALGELTAIAREGRTQPAEMSGGSFTITNVGVFGVDAGTPIINPGESAILCLGATRRQPWVLGTGEDERLEIRDVCTLALSFDHRHVDGESGSRFLADVASIMEDPASALLF